MPNSVIDLHCHSTASDGSLSPEELVARAHGNGVRYLAITDHDTNEGLQAASKQARSLGITLIPGVEFSCEWGKTTVHLLALNFPLESSQINEIVASQLQLRAERAHEIGARLERKNMPGMHELAIRFAGSGVPGRPHFARAMVEAGHVKDINEAFKRYLGQGKIGDVRNYWPQLSELTAKLVETGADVVIAHPRKYKISLTKLREMIADFKAAGGVGLEVVTSGQKQGEVGMLGDLCRRFELRGSIGSDFHSPSATWSDLGRIPKLPDSVDPIWGAWDIELN